MLVKCVECGGQVSDKAVFCPHCGYVANTPSESADVLISANLKPTRAKRSRMRLPNGFGSIKKLSGDRRKPYVAYPTVPKTQYTDDGKKPNVKALGYFETWSEAYNCLLKFNECDGMVTFSQVYERWYKDKFSSGKSFSTSTEKNYQWAYGLCPDLYDMPFASIHKSEMQSVIDEQGSGSSAEVIAKLFGQMFNYAIQEGLVTTNYAKYVTIPSREVKMGLPLTVEEIKSLWAHKDDTLVQIALILVYSGLRVSELKKTTIDLERGVFEGGIKTTAGKGRIIPIHSAILPIVKEFDQKAYSPTNYTDKQFKKVKDLCDFDIDKKCTPHSCRHTFSWLWDRDVEPKDDVAKHLVMGHSLGNDVDVSTYGHRTLGQIRDCIEKIKTDK